MATAGDGAAPYQGGGVGGKFRKRPIRRSAQATPYDRPSTALRNSSPSLFSKLVDPASRLIYAGADRLFGIFRKRLPALPSQRPRETNEEPRNGLQKAGPNNCAGVSEPNIDQGGTLASVPAAAEISELENMLKQKTFTRSEIERLTALLHSRTMESSSDDVCKGDGAKLPSTSSHLLRLEASTSRPLNKHVEERENFHAIVSTPDVNSRVLEDDVASPAELAKAYMGTRPAKVSPSILRLGSQALRQDSVLLNNTTDLPKTPVTSLAPKTVGSFRAVQNGFTTPRSRGRSAIYNMARSPYYRGPSTFSQQGVKSDYGHGVVLPSLAFSESAREHEGPFGSSKMALKRRSSVLDDDIGSGGPVRRIRQKANLLSQGSSLSKHRRDFGSTAFQQAGSASQKLLLMNEPEPRVSKKAAEENGETSMRTLGYASVPTKSTQMASKILEQLERLSPKEKSSGSRLAGPNEKSPTKLTSNMIHGKVPRSLEKVDAPKAMPSSQDNQKSDDQHRVWLPDARESSSQGKDKTEENGPRSFAIPCNVLSTMNGNSVVPVSDNALIVTNTDSTLKLSAEPPQKKRSFQMSAHEDSLEPDDDNEYGHVSVPLSAHKKPETSVVGKKDVSAEAQSEILTHPLPESCKTSLPEVAKIPDMAKLKKVDDAISLPKTDFGPPGGSVNEQKMGFNFPTSTPSSSNTQSAVISQPNSMVDTVPPQKEPKALPVSGTSTKNAADKVPPFLFSANEPPSGFKPNASSDAKPLASTSLFNSVMKNNQAQFSVSNKDNNGNGPKSVNMSGKSEPSSSDSPTTRTSGVFSFGGSTKNASITNGTPASNTSLFSFSSSFPASGSNTNNLFKSSLSHVSSSSTTATSSPSITTSVPSSSVFSTSAPSPIFSFGSANSSSTSASMAPTSAAEAPETNATKDKESKSNNTSSSNFASTSFATASSGSSIFGYSSPAATSTTTNQSQGSFFNVSNGSQANPQVVVPFQFGSSKPSLVSATTGNPSSSSGSSPFGSSVPAFSSAPSFGLSSAVASSGTNSGGPTSGGTTNVFGSAFGSTPSFGLGSAVASTESNSISSTSGSATSVFASGWQPPKSSAFGSTFASPSTTFSFGASSTSMPSASSSPIMFGSSNAGASTGSSMFSFTAAGATNSSFPTPSQGQSVFGNSTPVFGAAASSPNNNDQMSMEDSMAEDSMQTPNPSVPAFGQASAGGPGFMFGSATPTPQSASFQFGGQPTQAPPQNPFQASGSVEFNAGGSFSLGSGGGDKSGRRILRVKGKNRRK